MAILQMNEIGSSAKAYRAKPQNMGGGGGSYNGFNIPQTLQNDASTWKFDTRISDDELNVFMISNQIMFDEKPYLLTGQHKNGELVSIKLFDPQRNQWETLFNEGTNTNYTCITNRFINNSRNRSYCTCVNCITIINRWRPCKTGSFKPG